MRTMHWWSFCNALITASMAHDLKEKKGLALIVRSVDVP
jgi:hypothetical protein